MQFLYKSMVPLGLVFDVIIILAVLTGLRVIRVKFWLHRLLGIVGAAGGLIHGLVGIYATIGK